MGKIKQLEKELELLKEKRQSEKKVKLLKKQIKAEKFAQTKTGKIFNKIADIGDAGFKATKNFLSEKQEEKPIKKRKSVNEIINDLPQ